MHISKVHTQFQVIIPTSDGEMINLGFMYLNPNPLETITKMQEFTTKKIIDCPFKIFFQNKMAQFKCFKISTIKNKYARVLLHFEFTLVTRVGWVSKGQMGIITCTSNFEHL
jgi:hypothetical protein